MMRTAAVSALFAGALVCQGILAGAACASGARGTLVIHASVTSYCDIGGSPSLKMPGGLLDFGSHRLADALSGLGGPDRARPFRASMPLLCSGGDVMPLVSFGYGLHAVGRQRYLQGPGGSLVPYELMRGASPGLGRWDENAYPVQSIAGKIGNVPVYGFIARMPVNASDGSYSDTVMVRIDF